MNQFDTDSSVQLWFSNVNEMPQQASVLPENILFFVSLVENRDKTANKGRSSPFYTEDYRQRKIKR